jgi:hypothetical protein
MKRTGIFEPLPPMWAPTWRERQEPEGWEDIDPELEVEMAYERWLDDLPESWGESLSDTTEQPARRA